MHGQYSAAYSPVMGNSPCYTMGRKNKRKEVTVYSLTVIGHNDESQKFESATVYMNYDYVLVFEIEGQKISQPLSEFCCVKQQQTIEYEEGKNQVVILLFKNIQFLFKVSIHEYFRLLSRLFGSLRRMNGDWRFNGDVLTGFDNVGNTCFANSVMSILCSLEGVQQLFFDERLPKMNVFIDTFGGMCSHVALPHNKGLRKLYERVPSAEILVRNSGLQLGYQHDSGEFLMSVFEMSEQFFSPINQLFNMEHKQETVCRFCRQKKASSVSRCSVLQLTLFGNKRQSIREFVVDNWFRESLPSTCEKCNEKQSDRFNHISELSKYLVIAVNRNIGVKNSTPIAFEEELRLGVIIHDSCAVEPLIPNVDDFIRDWVPPAKEKVNGSSAFDMLDSDVSIDHEKSTHSVVAEEQEIDEAKKLEPEEILGQPPTYDDLFSDVSDMSITGTRGGTRRITQIEHTPTDKVVKNAQKGFGRLTSSKYVSQFNTDYSEHSNLNSNAFPLDGNVNSNGYFDEHRKRTASLTQHQDHLVSPFLKKQRTKIVHDTKPITSGGQRTAIHSQSPPPVHVLGEGTTPAQIKTVYSLRGIVVHSGFADGGHYISYVKRGNIWYEYNDDLVTEDIPFKTVQREARNVVLFMYELD
ncbi:hypothetical protein PCE1_000878 [Barthelona sp. PCE]